MYDMSQTATANNTNKIAQRRHNQQPPPPPSHHQHHRQNQRGWLAVQVSLLPHQNRPFRVVFVILLVVFVVIGFVVSGPLCLLLLLSLGKSLSLMVHINAPYNFPKTEQKARGLFLLGVNCNRYANVEDKHEKLYVACSTILSLC